MRWNISMSKGLDRRQFDEHDKHEHHDDHCGCGCEHGHEHHGNHDHGGHHHEHHEDHDHEHHHHDDDCDCGCEHEHHHGDHGHSEHDHEHHEDHNHDFDNIAGSNQITYIVQNLGCANCAAKMERKIQSLPQVQAASLTFATKQLRVAADDPRSLKPQLEKICRAIEDQVYLEEKSQLKAPAKHEQKGVFKQNIKDILSIIIGAVLFAAGMVIHHAKLLPVQAVFGIFIVAYIVLGWKVLWTSAKNISKGQIFDENFLMAVATIAAFCIGEFAEGVGVMLFYSVGELFEHIAVEKSRAQIMDAVDMRPETVNLVHGDHSHVVPAEKANIGDILLVRPGDRIPLDGIITEGESRIDTSPVTGEPVPVSAHPGTEVISGCVNEQGLIKIRVTKPLSESMVTRILDSVENAAAGKPQIDKFITKFAKIYTPIVVLLALLVAIIPSIVSGNWGFWIETAITFLVISCPCALVISVPLAFFSGIGAGSKLGILFKGGLSIEALKKVKAVVMDKTGTITKGNFVVQEIITADGISENDVLAIAAACEAASTHPIAKSIMDEAAKRSISIDHADKIDELSGLGVKASLTGWTVLCGNKKLLEKYGVSVSEQAVSGTGTHVLLALDGKFIGSITISDTLKDNAIGAISSIKAKGLLPVMLTGDNAASAKAVAGLAGIDRVYAQLMPEDKLTILKELREETGSVMFVGDGINDAPVLAGADVGAAMGSGADAAIEAADVVFMNSSLEAIPQSINIAKSTGTISYQNIVFALAVKLIVLVMGLLGFANIWAAIFADTGVAMLCILNSLRILLKKFK